MSQEISGAVKVLQTALCVMLENDFIRTSFVVQSAKVIVAGYCFESPLGYIET